jgi:hypothetical protein
MTVKELIALKLVDLILRGSPQASLGAIEAFLDRTEGKPDLDPPGDPDHPLVLAVNQLFEATSALNGNGNGKAAKKARKRSKQEGDPNPDLNAGDASEDA